MTSRFASLLGAAALLLGASLASAQTTFTFIGTATDSNLDYTVGQSVTFTLTTGPSFASNTFSSFNSTSNSWAEETTSNDQLFTALSGTGLSGSLVRPTASGGDPNSSLTTQTASLNFVLSADVSTNLGISQPAGLLRGFSAAVGFAGSPDYNPFTASGSYSQPDSYFIAYDGDYHDVSGTLQLFDPSNVTAHFAISEVIIGSASAIPEPSTVAAILGGSAFTLAAWRKSRRRSREQA